MGELIERFPMRTNFAGLIRLLAKHLYAEPDVFVRELIQNAHDSIVRRQKTEASLAGRVDILVNPAGRTITFVDNGIGMDQEDIKEFLAVIGSTGTGLAREELEDIEGTLTHDLIGQFGVGMLSAFVVAERVVVRTRKAGENTSFAWHNSGSTDCELYTDDKADVGTEIIVSVGQIYSFILDQERIREAIVKYCDFVPYPISLNGEGPVNTIEAPWHRRWWPSSAEKEAAYRVFVNRRYPDVPLDLLPVEIDEPYRARGVLYISDRNFPEFNTAGVVDIFVRRMFIRAGDRTFLPPWAMFVRGIVESPDLQPTAARDDVQRTDPAFQFLQTRFGELIVERLGYLAEHEPNRFRQINQWHHYHLKGMALRYPEFFEKVANLLLFETNRGHMSLNEYLTKNAVRPDYGNKVPLYYFAFEGGAAQFYRLADARGWVILNAGREFEEELLQEYAERNQATVHLARIDATDDPELFHRLEPAEQDRFRRLELDVETQLRRGGLVNVQVITRRYAPAQLPAVVIVTPETEAELKLREWVSTSAVYIPAFEELAQQALEQSRSRTLHLALNADSPIVQRLAGADAHDEMTHEVLIGLYNSAILYSRNLLNRQNSEVMHGQFVRLFDRVLTHRSELAALRQSLEQERRQLVELRRQHSEDAQQRPDHIVVFMMTPFDDRYRRLEEAVRRIFEKEPYCFEVVLARDYIHDDALLSNVRRHIMRAHGFIAELTEHNPNVMLELGATLMLDDRPVLSIGSRESKLPVPADIREKLRIHYSSLNRSSEELEVELREAVSTDGRPRHYGILALMELRRKHFLSRTLLESLGQTLPREPIAALMAKYQTLEDLLAADVKEIAAVSNLRGYSVTAICGELLDRVPAAGPKSA
ncbi:MAG: ATP-binding protein [Actinoplanes sp.]